MTKTYQQCSKLSVFAVAIMLLSCSSIHTAYAESYSVRNIEQFTAMTERINQKQGAKLKKFIDTVDRSAKTLTPQQQSQYCQLEQDRINENYDAYNANRQLFTGPGANLTKKDFVQRVQNDPISQALRRQGLVCHYQ